VIALDDRSSHRGDAIERTDQVHPVLSVVTALPCGISSGLLVQIVVTGLAAGATYGLVAVGFDFLYRATSALQFAQGDLAGAAVVVALAVTGSTTSLVNQSSPGLKAIASLLAIVTVTAASTGLGVLVVWRRPRRPEGLPWLGIVVGAALLLGTVVRAAVPQFASFPELVPHGNARVVLPFGAGVERLALWQLAIGFLIAVTVDQLLVRTHRGRALVAVSDDADAARVVGLPVRQLVLVAFALAGALTAAAGLLAESGSVVSPDTGAVLGVNAIAAVVLARFGGRRRVFATALALGIAEAAIVAFHVGSWGPLGVEWRVVLPVLVAIAVIAIHPPRFARDIRE
jgi:branched-subunit amino acid ABC-type transport system permease component